MGLLQKNVSEQYVKKEARITMRFTVTCMICEKELGSTEWQVTTAKCLSCYYNDNQLAEWKQRWNSGTNFVPELFELVEDLQKEVSSLQVQVDSCVAFELNLPPILPKHTFPLPPITFKGKGEHT